MESENYDIKTFYKYSEIGIKSRNIDLYQLIINYGINNNIDCEFKGKFYLMVNV